MNDQLPPDHRSLPIPEETFTALDADSQAAGGEWKSPEQYEGAIGRTMFDAAQSEDGTITILLPQQCLDSISSQSLVRIESRADRRIYLGAVVAGPFAEPDGLRADSPPIVISTVQGGLMLPKYHGRAQVELLGEQLLDGTVIPPRRRPKPNSPVFPLTRAETSDVLGIKPEYTFTLGLAEGFDDLEVRLPARSKNVFPRHLGILGTTGSGKSTTVSGLIAKAQRENMAIVLIDTEGEYCAIHEATTDPVMLAACQQRGITPAGVPNTHVYHVVGRETSHPDHPRITPFSPRFWSLSPFALQEILELNDAQSERFFTAYSLTRKAMAQFKIFPRQDARNSESDQRRVAKWDDQDTGYPMLKLDQLYDMVQLCAAVASKDSDEMKLLTREFEENREQINTMIRAAKPTSEVCRRALQGRLGKLRRLKIFDSTAARSLNFGEMLQPGRVTILDLSTRHLPQINNLIIAELLRGIQSQQERNYKAALQRNDAPTPTLIFLEEAHEFLSSGRIQQMPTLFAQVARIARRGRKRWLGLVFITQLPQHLPDEVLSLINNWILHKITDTQTIARLRRTIPALSDPVSHLLPTLPPGHSLTSFPTLPRPLPIVLDPSPCRLLMVE